MNHGISDQEWEDYLAGQSAPQSQAWLDKHLTECIECWEIYQRESLTMRALGKATAEAKARLTVRDEQLLSMFSAIMEKVRGTELPANNHEACPERIHSSLELLHTVLAPVFGPKGILQAMQLAANDASTRSLDAITRETWEPFVDRLTAITSIVCGDVVAGLIREHAEL